MANNTNKLFSEVKGTIEEKAYQDALQDFLDSNVDELAEAIKISITENPDEYVYFSNSEDGLDVTLKKKQR